MEENIDESVGNSFASRNRMKAAENLRFPTEAYRPDLVPLGSNERIEDIEQSLHSSPGDIIWSKCQWTYPNYGVMLLLYSFRCSGNIGKRGTSLQNANCVTYQ